MSVGGIKPCCASGSLHTGTPTGRIITLDGLQTYIAEPSGGIESAKGVVVIIPDLFGWEFLNNRVLADDYAKKGGVLVLLPDFMNGYVVPESLMTSITAIMTTGLLANLKKIYHAAILAYYIIPFFWRNTDSVVRPQILSYFRSLKTTYPNLPVGAAGFCWGGKWTVELCWARDRASPPVGQAQPQTKGQSGGSGEPLVVCGFTAHPSRLTYPTDIEAVELPIAIAASGGFDPQMSREQGEQTRKILEGKTKKDGGDVEHEFVWYEGATHGFAVRADEDDVEEAERGRKAEEQALAWFGKWFAAASKS